MSSRFRDQGIAAKARAHTCVAATIVSTSFLSGVLAQNLAPLSVALADPAVYDPLRGVLSHLPDASGRMWLDHEDRGLQVSVGQPTVDCPVTRQSAALAFDDRRGRIYLFGGRTSALLPLGDFWSFDGFRWEQPPLGIRPPRRSAAAMAYDSVRDRLVLFGGVDQAELRDTWEFDGANWFTAPAHPVAGQTNPRMAFDPPRQNCVMLGSATWTYDGQGWLQQASLTTGASVLLCYDPARRVVVGNFGGQFRDWNGSTWVSGPAPTHAFSPRQLYFDAAQQLVIARSAENPGFGTTWNGTATTQLPYACSSVRPQIAYDPVAGRVFALGKGRAAGTNDTWQWDGENWSLLPNASVPSRDLSATTFDPVHNRWLRYGGLTNSGYSADLWSFDGATWTLVAANGPPGIILGGLAFDTGRNRLVLGAGARSVVGNDTWEWDGAAWTRMTVTTAGPAGFASAAYDPVLGVTIFTAGSSSWSWNGANWASLPDWRSPAAPRPTILYASPIFDPVRGRTQWSMGTAGLWEFDGTQWSRRTDVPYPNVETAMAYDSARQRLVYFDKTTVYETGVQAAVARYGAPCGTPTAVLNVHGFPRVGTSTFALMASVDSRVGCLLGFANAQLQFDLGNGCSALIAPPFATAIALADGRGLAHFGQAIPRLPSLVGATVFAQAAAIANDGSLRVTHGLRMTVGE